MTEEEQQANEQQSYHQMGRRGHRKNYCWPGTYHITISVKERQQQPLGRLAGDASKPDGDPEAPRVVLSEVGEMVEQELLHSIKAHYAMVEVQDYVIMPDHLHFILVVSHHIISSRGRETHLGQVIAGFKKGCNRRYWELTGKAAAAGSTGSEGRGKPANAGEAAAAQEKAGEAEAAPTSAGLCPRPAVYPQGYKVPSRGTSGRPPLFAEGYVDVMPLEEWQLETQRAYIRNNPRNRLLRMAHRDRLSIRRGDVSTALTPGALKGYLTRECPSSQFNADIWTALKGKLLTADGLIVCDSYGDHRLLEQRLLPVVCHRRDAALLAVQRARCLAAAADGAVLVSAHIAAGERDIMNAAAAEGYRVVSVEDNGFTDLYHPSERRMALCAEGHLLLVTPWRYSYRPADMGITVLECKAMNCVVQAICRTKDSWWKEG